MRNSLTALYTPARVNDSPSLVHFKALETASGSTATESPGISFTADSDKGKMELSFGYDLA